MNVLFLVFNNYVGSSIAHISYNIKDVTNIDELKNNRKDALQKQKEASLKREYLDKLIEEIRKDSKFDVADEIINEEVEGRKRDLENRLKQSGIDLEQYKVLTRTTDEALNEQLKGEAQKGIESFLIMDNVKTKENITLSDEEFDFELAKMADQYNMSIDQIKEALGRQLGQFRNNLLMSRIEDFLYNNNK